MESLKFNAKRRRQSGGARVFKKIYSKGRTSSSATSPIPVDDNSVNNGNYKLYYS